MEILIVHLTDLHVKQYEDLDKLIERGTSLSGEICNHITEPDETALCISVTGDIAYSGEQEQYDIVELFFDEIYRNIEKRYPKVSIYIILVPGNHDCDFDNENNGIRKTVLSSALLDINDKGQLKTCTSIQANFFAFAERLNRKYNNTMFASDDLLVSVNTLSFKEQKVNINFHCINTSWCSDKNEIKGKMKLPLNFIPVGTSDDINIALMHHDIEWLGWESIEKWKEYCKKYIDIVLVGHDHVTDYVIKKNYDETTNYYIKGNQLYSSDKPEQSGFNILKIKTTSNMECFFSFQLNNKIYKEIINTDYRPFQRNRYVSNSIELKEEVYNFLEEIDIDIINKNKRELRLSDIYVFPTLREEQTKGTRLYREKKDILKYLEENKYISIRGEKEYGKTALLKQLFIEYFTNKKYPIFITDIAKIRTSDGEELNKIVKEAYSYTYKNIDVDEIMQKGAESRVCIIDNFEEIVISDKSAKKLLQYLTQKFEIVIISRNPKLDLINPLNYIEMNDFFDETFKVLSIQPVRNQYRKKIIDKWISIDYPDIEIGSVFFDSIRKEKNSQLTSVMKKQYFNKTPMEILMVLSYLDQDQRIQTDYSRYSYIYDGLILSKLNAISNKDSNTATIYKTILQSFAYKMYNEEIQGFVEEQFLFGIIFDYKEKFSNIKLKADDVVDKLVNYKFLEVKNDMYRFKFNYMFYYFAASFINKHLSPDKKQAIIQTIFENIDLEINYNIALFLAYNMNVQYEILPIIIDMEQNLLSDYNKFNYKDLEKFMRECGYDIEQKINKKYIIPENKEIPALQEQRLIEMDEVEAEEEEDIAPTEEDIRRDNKEVLKIGRLVDFSGNILKNYSGEMENEPREQAIKLMFKAVIKVLGTLSNFSMYMVDRLIKMIEEKNQEKDEETIQAKTDFIEIIKYMFSEIWFEYIGMNVTTLAAALECDIIKENIANYCQREPSDFNRMAQLEYLIRIAGTQLPIDQINNLFFGEKKLDYLSQSILKDNISRYLCSYQFDDKDRQRVCELLGFNIKNVTIEKQKLIVASER